jgi:hypothetical protein
MPMKTEILSNKFFTKPNGLTEPLIAFKQYYKLREAIEIDITEYSKANRDNSESGFSTKYFENKQMPFKNILFIDTDSLTQLHCLFTLTASPVPLYEFYFFNTLPDDIRNSHKKPLEFIGQINMKFNGSEFKFIYPNYVELKQDSMEEYDISSEEAKSLAKQINELESEMEKLQREIFEINSKLMQDMLYQILCAITTINDNRILHQGTLSLEEIDNKVLEVIGDETRIVKIKPGLFQSRFKLLNKRGSPRYHSVRGHFRHYKNGNIVFVESFERGDKKKGIITSIYKPQLT